MIDDEYIIYKFSDKNGKINPNKTRNSWIEKHPDIKEYLSSRYPDDDFVSFKFTLQRIFNHIDELPQCENCGKKIYAINQRWCDQRCQLSDRKFIKYRESIPDLKQRQIKKAKITWKSKTQDEINAIYEKAINTRKERYGDKYSDLVRQGVQRKYGVNNVFQLGFVKEKVKQTKLSRYGDAKYVNHQKAKDTIKRKYGVDEWMQSPIFIKKSKETKIEKYGDPMFTNREKAKQTCIEHFGVDNWWKTEENNVKCHSEEATKKKYETLRRNNTFNKSQMEDKAFLIVRKKYPDTIRQYTSIVYPFNCDMYIPSIDLYIECQFGQFHHYRPYLGTKADKEEVDKLAKKANLVKLSTGKLKSRYDAEIETWTIRDVKKRECAKANHLNYIELWDLDEVKKFIND